MLHLTAMSTDLCMCVSGTPPGHLWGSSGQGRYGTNLQVDGEIPLQMSDSAHFILSMHPCKTTRGKHPSVGNWEEIVADWGIHVVFSNSWHCSGRIIFSMF